MLAEETLLCCRISILNWRRKKSKREGLIGGKVRQFVSVSSGGLFLFVERKREVGNGLRGTEEEGN